MNKFLFFAFVIFTSLHAKEPIDLEAGAQDFVLETKQIKIEGFKNAFNPSIVRWEDKFLLSFRIRDPLTNSTNQVGVAILDQEGNVIGEGQKLSFPFKKGAKQFQLQDPRLLWVGEELHIVFSYYDPASFGKRWSRMYVAKITHENGHFSVTTPQPLLGFDGEIMGRREKNWVPFEYQNQLLLAYSIAPHRIMEPLYEKRRSQTIYKTTPKMPWNWGQLRGGTPALQVGDEYLSFFHSSIVCKTVHSNGRSNKHYFMGAYTFSKDPPFTVTKMSPKPIVGKNFYHGQNHKTWTHLRVVFPAGFVFDENFIWVAYGRQDHEIWITKIDRSGLFNSLVPVTQRERQ